MHKGSCVAENLGKDSEARANRHHQDYSNLSRESLQISICDWHRGWGVDQKYGEECRWIDYDEEGNVGSLSIRGVGRYQT